MRGDQDDQPDSLQCVPREDDALQPDGIGDGAGGDLEERDDGGVQRFQ